MKKHSIYFLIALFGLQSMVLNAQKIERVDPPNWWVGMKHNTIQVLVYGENINHWEPMINSQQVELKKVTRVENPNYLFLDVLISNKAAAGNIDIDFYRGKKKMHTLSYPILDRDMSMSRKGFDSSDVMYLITPDRFANGDPKNDVISGMKEKNGKPSRRTRTTWWRYQGNSKSFGLHS